MIGSASARRLPPGLLDGLAPAEAEQALWWHRHMSEVDAGSPRSIHPQVVSESR
ncbi:MULTISPECIES: hypothetical protein [Streptomyces]|uniref:hypothetical protein n=1 Tax=Streptomyces lycopersici TaxID=2974589 RepID=UPI0021CF3F91|nr:hypothetical protein [Streptomyces sp. NEAU-383]